jgi:hypothetical protein
MSETTGKQEPKPQDPELLPCQLEIKRLCEEILALKPKKFQMTYWDIQVSIDPNTLQDRLRSGSLADLMLEDGDTLSSPAPSEYHHDLNLYIGQAQMTGVTLRAWLWEYDKHRIDPNGPDKSPFDVISYPGEKDWTHQLDIMLHYKNETYTATQTITMQTGSMHAGKLPSISRDVSAAVYAEQGYEGHNQVYRDTKNAEEASAFITLARELFETSPQLSET